MELEAKLFKHFKPKRAGECWLWTGRLSKAGYARIWHDNKNVYVHRMMYLMHNGPIPVEKEVDHICRNRNCVNPIHLEAVSHAENVKRGTAGKINNWLKAKTHCKNGHPFSGSNLKFRANGIHRSCAICNKLKCDKYRRRLKRWKKRICGTDHAKAGSNRNPSAAG